MERSTRDTLLGLVFFGGLGLLIFATAELGNLSLEPRPRLVAHFADAAGLRVGDPVFVLGHRNGHVRSVTWVPDAPLERRIEVVLELQREIRFRRGARIEIRDATFLGGKEVRIDPGFGPPLEGDPPTATRKNPFDLLGESLSEADLGATVRSIRRFFESVNDPEGSVGALLSRREAYDELVAALRSVRKSVERIEKGPGPVHRLLYDERLGADLAAAASEARKLLEAARQGHGVVARLLNDARLADDLAAAATDLRAAAGALRDEKGLAGKLLHDEELAGDVAAAAASLRSVAAKLDDPRAGLAGALLGDEKMRADARRLVARLSEVAEGIATGKGLLARLVNDEDLAERVARLFRQVSRAVEDAREAAPVGTFFQVLAGPF